jgi:jumonji domain-containing protein 7
VSDWPALSWTHAYLRERLGAAPVHVALTPDGLGDAVKQHGDQLVFAKPHEALMPFAAFLDALETPLRAPPSAPPPSAPPPSAEVARRVGEMRGSQPESKGRGAGEAGRDGNGDADGEGGGGGDGDGDGDGGDGGGEGEGVLRRAVHYCSHQNSSLTEEFEELQTDWRPLAWADAAFGAPPAATNLWMGAGPCRNQGLYGRGSSAGQAVDWPRLAEARGARGTAWR